MDASNRTGTARAWGQEARRDGPAHACAGCESSALDPCQIPGALSFEPSWVREAVDRLEREVDLECRTRLLDSILAVHGVAAAPLLLGAVAAVSPGAVEAERRLREILVHQAGIESLVGRAMPLRAAAIDYWSQTEGTRHDVRLVLAADLERVHRAAGTDALTGLPNRRAWNERLAAAVNQAARYGEPLALAVLDLDDFKTLNDRHGHAAGDTALARVGRCITCSLRGSDYAARWGGEEFVILLPSTTKAGAVALLERMRACSRADASLPSPTISAGIASFPEDGRTPTELFAAADRMLSFAKASGKNRVAAYHEERRRYLRRNARIPVRFELAIGPGIPIDTVTLDVGGGGFSFAAHSALAPRTPVAGGITLGNSDPDAFRGHVVASAPSPPGYRIAVTFLEISESTRHKLAAG